MIRDNISPDEIIEFLNSLIAIDPQAMHALVETRVPCNTAMQDHPTVQVSDATVGLLGVLNGMMGVDDRDYGTIAAQFDDATGELIGFQRYKHAQES